MEKIWLKNYEEGVPAEIDINAYQSMLDIFNENFLQNKGKPIFSNFGTTMTFSELEIKSRQFASYLQNILNLKHGDRVAIMMPNLLQYPVVIFGIWRAGLCAVNVNPLYTATELTNQVNDAGAETIIILENFATTLEKAFPKIKLKNIIITKIGDLLGFPKSVLTNCIVKYVTRKVPSYSLPAAVWFKKTLREASKHHFQEVKLTHQDIALLQYTGGTTGISKAAILSHRNLVAMVQQLSAFGAPHFTQGKEIIINALPLYHIFSLLLVCYGSIKIVGLNVFITNPRDIPNFVKTLKKVPFTIIAGVNTLFNLLMNNPQFKEINFKSLQYVFAGSMTLHAATAERWKQLTQTTINVAYGLTESTGCLTISPFGIQENNGTVGLPLPSTEVAIFDDEGHELGVNISGEICARGPQIMQSYWNRPDETEKVMFGDGWLKTGDIGLINEEGYVSILERKKDMINISGLKVYPNEVEAVIVKHPGVLEVSVIGVNSNDKEVVKAYIVKKDPQLTEKDIIAHCREYLTRYKVPKQVEFVLELPKSTMGKILRRELRVQHKQSMENNKI